MGLDAGYLSRILAGFTDSGLIERHASDHDRRRQVITLTKAGQRAFAKLDALQSHAIASLTADLDEDGARQLCAAMGVIQRVLGDKPADAAVVLREPAPGDLGWVASRHGALYAAEYGWDATFEGLVARIVGDFAEARHRGDPVRAWIAESDGRRLGCVFCAHADDSTAVLRLLLVEPAARGTGLGSALVAECLRFARQSGHSRITLWTNDVLVNARRLYERAGFELDRTEPHRSFGKDLVGEYWSRDL
jgi:GNAT superfamily N-acetyltransferase